MILFTWIPTVVRYKGWKLKQQLPWAGKKRKRGLLLNEYRVSIWDNKNILEMDSNNGCRIVNVLKSTEVYTSKRWTLCYRMYIYLHFWSAINFLTKKSRVSSCWTYYLIWYIMTFISVFNQRKTDEWHRMILS